MLQGCRLQLRCDRSVWWPEIRTLLIADTHFGKAATFRNSYMPIPDGTQHDLDRLSKALVETGAERLVILGDLLHARRGRCPETMNRVTSWCLEHKDVERHLVIGNHDKRSGAPPEDWEFLCHDDPWELDGLGLAHYPGVVSGASLAGHLHPKFRINGAGDTLVLPGFLLRGQELVLPAFTEFVDSGSVRTTPEDRVFVIADQELLEI